MKTKLTVSFILMLAVIIAPMAARAESLRSDGYAGATKVPVVGAVQAYPFDLNDVRLLPSRFKTAMDTDKAYMLKLDVDRFMWPFYERAGLPVKGERYGGWEMKDVVGHTSGHYLSALSLMYASTGDPEMKRRIDYMVSELARVQQKNGNGYAGSVRPEVWTRIFAGDLEAGAWGVGGGYVPWYVLHKTFAGLIDAYVCAGNKQALDIACAFADWAKKGTDKLSDEQFQTMLLCEYGPMNEVLANLYALTGKKEYLSFAQRFDHKIILDPLANKIDQLQGKHVNTNLPKIIGCARLYELTGNERYATIARFLWDSVVDNHSMAPGGVDHGEKFFASGEEANHLASDGCETCAVYNMLKVTREVFGWQPDAKYMDYYERALYNQILGSQDPTSGGVTYFYSLKPGHFKIYSSPFDAMWCCVGTGIENHSKYADTIYYHNAAALWVNLFIPSELNWKEKGVNIKQVTQFPEKDTTVLTISTKRNAQFTINIRVPYWATAGAEVKINGKAQKVVAKPQSYLTLARVWKNDDKIEVRLPMSLHLRYARDDKKMAVIMYGPITLAGELGREGMPDSCVSSDPKAFSQLPPPPVPTLIIDSNDPSKWIKRVNGDLLRFQTVNAGKPNDVTLIPLSDIHDQRYTVYWKTMTSDQWDAQPLLKP